ncbi:MAG: hypothetical protein A2157_04645 [Deltaproteobacteria bacterium RBG_16_47_11]|nr:MAG: hypothetical protein A2157_04645 [Deltaproteobacteria bacterium RBG_16_47_11]
MEGGFGIHFLLNWEKKKMPERDPIDLIKEQLNGMEGLAGLHATHETFKRWHGETKTILEKAFSSKSIHCQSFAALKFREMGTTPFASPEIDKINAARYKRDLENAKNILLGAIKELTLDRTLFKKIQTTPKSVEVSLKGEYYLSSGIEASEFIRVIERAFEENGLSSLHGKDVSFQQRIDRIKRTSFGIYDISNTERVDTFLELGAALGLGKKVVLLCKKGPSLPETMKSLKRIEYESPSDLTEELNKILKC